MEPAHAGSAAHGDRPSRAGYSIVDRGGKQKKAKAHDDFQRTERAPGAGPTWVDGKIDKVEN